MADRPRTVWKLKRGIYGAAEWGEVTVTTADTVTISSLFATEDPLNAVFWRMDTGVEVTNNHNNTPNSNVCTITQAATTNVKCIYMVYGVRA